MQTQRRFLEIGHYFKIGEFFYIIQDREPFYYKYSTSVTASGETTKTSISDLEPEKGYVYHFYFGVWGPVGVKVFQPAAVQRKMIKGTDIDFITSEDSPYLYPNSRTETVTVADRPVSVVVKNLSSDSVTAKIRFSGYSYKVARVMNKTLLNYLMNKVQTGGLPIFSVEGKVIE